MSATATLAAKEIWMELVDRKRLARLMLINEVTQRQVASAAGWKSHTYLGRLLRGEVHTLDIDAGVRIAHFLKVGVEDLFVTRASNDVARSDQRRSA